MNRMTNRCKNITLATTSLRPVIISLAKEIKGKEIVVINANFVLLVIYELLD